jgi:peptidoglycan/LPS O-acetylase OafA/YrhL
MRFRALDSVRGIAALGVVLHHCFLTLPLQTRALLFHYFGDTPLRVILIGRPFVILFFILSGFVLAVSLLQGHATSFGAFMTKRLFRIYLPYVASLGLSILIFALVRPEPIAALSGWFASTWQDGVTPDVLMSHLLLDGTATGSSLNDVNWSLVYELRISLIFPALLWLLVRFGPLTTGTAALAVSGAADVVLHRSGLGLTPYFASTPVTAVALTAHFVLYFAIGAILAHTIHRYQARLGGLHWSLQWALIGVSVLLLMKYNDTVDGIGAGLLIALIVSAGWLSRLLEKRLPEFLGRISFSLYLVHLPILMGLTHLLYGHMPQPAIIGLAIVLAITTATLAYRFVELPSIQLGRLALNRRPAPPKSTAPI